MAVNQEAYHRIISELAPAQVTLVAVSKTKAVSDIKALYDLGQRDFGENYVQEMADKAKELPQDIRWHFIGHLQTNKVKYIASFVELIHGVDSLKLLKEINKQALKHNRVIDCLLQVHIATEETKFGLDAGELEALISQVENNKSEFTNIRVRGLMGMASFTPNIDHVRVEFKTLKKIFDRYRESSTFNTQHLPTGRQVQHPTSIPIAIGTQHPILSMGMSSDYSIALEEGSTMVRIGSLLFGARKYNQ